MKTLRLSGVGKFQISDEPIPVPLQGEQLVNVKAVGVCGSRPALVLRRRYR